MHNPFRRRAVFTFTAFFAASVLINYYFGATACIFAALITSVLFVLCEFRIVKTNIKDISNTNKKPYFRLIGNVIMILASALLASFLMNSSIKNNTIIELKFANKTHDLTAKIDTALNTGNSDSVSFYLDKVIINGEKVDTRIRVFSDTKSTENLKYGDIISIKNAELESYTTKRNPGGINNKMNANSNGSVLFCGEGIIIKTGHEFSLMDYIYRLREKFLNVIDEQCSEQTAGAMKGIVFGYVSSMDEEWLDAYRVTGIAHVLSVSGLHVSMIALTMAFLTKRMKNKLAALVISVFTILFYCAICGFIPPVTRSAVLGIFMLVARYLGEKGDMLTAIGISSFLILVLNPFAIFSLSFILSFTAVLGLVLFTPTFDKLFAKIKLTKKSKLASSIFSAISASLAAQLGIMPAQLQVFGTIPLLSLPMNVISLPLGNITVVTGLLGVVLGAVHPVLGWIPIKIAELALYVMSQITVVAASIRGSVLVAGAQSTIGLLAIFAVMMALCVYTKKNKYRAIFALVAVVMFAGDFAVKTHKSKTTTEVIFLDVGQGDAIYISHEGKHILLDAGALHNWPKKEGNTIVGTIDIDYGKTVILPFLRHKGIGKLDAIIVSHPDADHCGGFASVIEEVQYDALYVSDKEATGDSTFEKLIKSASEQTGEILTISAGDKILLGGLKISVLWPSDIQDDTNESSLVLRADFGENSVLFTGDIGSSSEEKLLGYVGECDILKVAHHGSKFGTGNDFLAEVKPKIAVISAGKNNRYGHPANETVDRLNAVGADIYTTSEFGAITAILYEDKIVLYSMK